MYYFLVGISTLLFFLGLKMFAAKTFYNFVSASAKQLNLILDNASEESIKQKNILANLKHILLGFAKIIILTLVIFFIAIIPIYLFTYFNQQEFSGVDFTSWKFLLATAIGSLPVFLIPSANQGYSYWSRLIHELVLDNNFLSKLLFKIEKRFFLKKEVEVNNPFVVVSGLARAGTTAFTKKLFKTGKFDSLSYANMPLVLSPNLWAKLYKPKNVEEKERAHGDRMSFSLNSIEALDEYFFKAFQNDNYIKKDSVIKHAPSVEVYEEYLHYQKLVKKKDDNFYLTKNNNFLLRYEGMRQHDTDFVFLLVIRDPLSHASSLLAQHKNFIKQQQDDPFVLQYMNWLGHFEFGLNQKEFDFGQNLDLKSYDKLELNYWLSVWINYYNYAHSILGNKQSFVISYDAFVEDPSMIVSKVSKQLNADLIIPNEERFKKSQYNLDETTVERDLIEMATAIYDKILKYSL